MTTWPTRPHLGADVTGACGSTRVLSHANDRLLGPVSLAPLTEAPCRPRGVAAGNDSAVGKPEVPHAGSDPVSNSWERQIRPAQLNANWWIRRKRRTCLIQHNG